jgi:hypothetical protein
MTCPSVLVRGVDGLPADLREIMTGVLGPALDSALAYEVRWDGANA